MKPGEHRIIGCGVLLQPEPVDMNNPKRGGSFGRFIEVCARGAAIENALPSDKTAALNAVLAIYNYARMLEQCPHNAAQSPANIAAKLLLLIRDGP